MGTFSGGAFGIFVITVELDYSGSSDNETILGSTKNDLLREIMVVIFFMVMNLMTIYMEKMVMTP